MQYIGEIASFLMGVLGGSLVTYKVTKKSAVATGTASIVDQSSANAGGDIVGGNKTDTKR